MPSPTERDATPEVESVNLTQVTEPLALQIGAMMARVWPKPERDAAFRAARLIEQGAAYSGPPERAPHAFILRDATTGPDGVVVASALMLPRTIAFGDPGGAPIEMTVLGLAGVVSDPDRRGEGLGARIVRAAFGMIDAGAAPFSLFQTSHAVRPFYDRLNAALVDNRIYNSLGDDPQANPFWDDVVMRYPATGPWPDEPIDLRGPGY